MSARGNRADRRATERRLAAAALRAGCVVNECTRPLANVLLMRLLGLDVRLYVCEAHEDGVRSRVMVAAMAGGSDA